MASESNGKRKAAILLATMGKDAAKGVLKQFSDDQIEEITLEIASLGKISREDKSTVLEEFYKMAAAREQVVSGGLDYAKDLLEEGLGSKKALEILDRLQGALQEVPFEFMRKTDPNQIFGFIQDEHPQTIALILSHLDPSLAAPIISALPENIRAEVIVRIATMDRTAPEMVKEVEKVLESKISMLLNQEFTFAGGVKTAAEVLNRVDRGTEKSIFGVIEEKDPELVEEIKRLMFVFEDIILVDDMGIQKALREIDNRDLALALKAASDEVKEKIYQNMSERAQQIIEEEIEYMGPVRLRNVEEAQLRIVSIIRRLEEAGEAIISGRGGEEDEIIV